MSVQKVFLLLILLIIAMLSVSQSILAQSTAFSYQGKLTDNGNLANGSHDFQFKLFDTVTVGTGTQQGTTVTVSNVTVSNGSFSVSLDFGVCPICFDGSLRFLEVAVKPTGGSTFTTLTPRQPINSAPYALKSLNATTADGLSLACVNCVTSSQIQSVQGSQVTGSISGSQINGTIPVASVPAGSANYIQNGTSQQASSNINISGNGTAGGTLTGSIVNAVQQVNINGLRAFTVNGAYNQGNVSFTASNTFAGDGAGVNTIPDPNLASPGGKLNSFYGAGAGQANTTGWFNSIFGNSAGYSNTTGRENAFFGSFAGNSNTTGNFNAFFGNEAGRANTTGSGNAFFGWEAGSFNTTGQQNAFFGWEAGYSNTTGNNNAFVGYLAGQQNTTGIGNAFFGYQAGALNTTGSGNAFFGNGAGNNTTTGFSNTFIGTFANFNMTTTGNYNTLLGYNTRVTSGITNSAAIGALASVTQSNSLVLGSINGVNSATADTNVGIGTTSPIERLHVVGNGLITGNFTVNGAVNLPSLAGQFIQNSTTQQSSSNFNITGNGIVGGSLSVGNANTSARLYLNRASAIAANSADINFISGGTPDFSLGTSQGSAAPSDFSIYNYGTSSNVITISRSTGFVGIGTTASLYKLHVNGGSDGGVRGDSTTSVGVRGTSTNNYGVGGDSTNSYGVRGTSTNSYGVYGTSTNSYAGFFDGKVFAIGIVSLGSLGSSGSSHLCINASQEIAGCSSSLRYKTAIQPFTGGLDLLKRLRPISFTWKQGGMRDLGFGAEEVEKVEPLLVTYNAKGEVEGVKYDRLTVALVNAAREQQAQIDQQQAQIKQQQAEIAALRQELQQVKQQKKVIQQQQQEMAAIKRLLCASHPRTAICKTKSLK